jgi:hypothetical protein
MDNFGFPDLRRLIETREGPCVTICMPTHVFGPEEQQDVIRLKNLADQAELQLADGWLRGPEARDLIVAVRNLPNEYDFWENRSHGLAIFLNRESLLRFRVPICLNELVVVNHRFHVRPLLPLLSSRDRFYILALSQHHTRLFEANQFQVEQVDVKGLPQRIEEALALDGADRGMQSHSVMRAGKGKQSSSFHGQGGVKDTHKDDLMSFFRLVDEAIMPVLNNETHPLILAGVDYLLPIFRKTCHYKHLVKPQLEGNCDHLRAREVHTRVWPLVEPLLSHGVKQAAAKYSGLAGTEKVTNDPRKVLSAACNGRIETLFIALDRHIWGECDPMGHVLELHDEQQSGDQDLIDLALVQTLQYGGRIYAVSADEMPTAEPLAAVMRF